MLTREQPELGPVGINEILKITKEPTLVPVRAQFGPYMAQTRTVTWEIKTVLERRY